MVLIRIFYNKIIDRSRKALKLSLVFAKSFLFILLIVYIPHMRFAGNTHITPNKALKNEKILYHGYFSTKFSFSQ
jgi:hypothetical protein